MTTAAEIVFWVGFAALAWTHALYPLAAMPIQRIGRLG